MEADCLPSSSVLLHNPERRRSSVNRVHFQESQDADSHDANIIINQTNENTLNVHLGFLQLNYRYEVKFVLHPCPIKGPLAVRNSEPANLNAHITDLHPIKGSTQEGSEVQYEVILELVAYKERLLREPLILQSSDNSLQILTLVLNARVLGKGQGTPFLKEGIRCIAVGMEEESEYETWHQNY